MVEVLSVSPNISMFSLVGAVRDLLFADYARMMDHVYYSTSLRVELWLACVIWAQIDSPTAILDFCLLVRPRPQQRKVDVSLPRHQNCR